MQKLNILIIDITFYNMITYIEQFLGGDKKLLLNSIEIELEPVMAPSSSFPFSKLMKILKKENKINKKAMFE